MNNHIQSHLTKSIAVLLVAISYAGCVQGMDRIKQVAQAEKPFVLSEAVDTFVLEYNLFESQRDVLVRGLSQVKAGQRKDVLVAVASFVEGVSDGSDRAQIIKALFKVDPENWKHFTSVVSPFVEGINGFWRVRIIKALSKVDPENWERFSSVVSPFIEGVSSGCYRGLIIEALSKVDPENWERFPSVVSPFLKGVSDGFARVCIIKALSKVDPENWERFPSVASFVEGVSDGYERAIIIKALSKVDLENWECFPSVVSLLVEGVSDDSERESIIKALSKVDPENWELFSSLVSSSVEGVSEGFNRVRIIEALSKVDPENWERFTSVVSPLVEGVSDGYDRVRIIEILSEKAVIAALDSMDPELWSRFSGADASEVQDNVVRLLGALDKKNALELARCIVKCKDIPVKHVFLQKARSIVIDDVMQDIQSPEKEKAKNAVDFLLEHYKRLGLVQEDPVFQEAIRVGILLDQSDDPRSPFRVYEELQAKRTQPIEYSALKPPREVISGCPIRLIPKSFRTIREAQVTYSQLPPHSKSFICDMRSHLVGRVAANKDLDDEIQRMTQSTLNGLIAGALGGDYLECLLQRTGEDTERVPILVGKFIAIVAYIEGLPREREGYFSQQEEAFIRMLASIRHCAIGKAEGINKYYANVLPEEYKLSSCVLQEEDEMPSVVVNAVIRAVENLCTCTTQFMKFLCGMGVNEAYQNGSGVHQETYLKNLIGDVMPLNRVIAFDTFTQNILSRALLALSKQEVMAAMFNRYLRPSQMVYAVRKNINAALAQKGSTFMDLNKILDGCIEPAKAWNTEGDSISITELGTIYLLDKLGIITIEKVRDEHE